MNESRERWLGAARRLARRVNLGTWLALWVPLATALSLASAALLVVLRRRAVTDLDAFWAAYAGALCLAGLAALVHTWRERETAPSALVWLEHRLGLNNRLSSAADGVGAWPELTPDAWRLVRWRLRGFVPAVLFSVSLLVAARHVPVSVASATETLNVERPPVWAELETWLEEVRESALVEEEAIESWESKIAALEAQPPEDWYRHSSLEASDSLKEELASELVALERRLRRADASLAELSALTEDEGASPSARRLAQSQLGEATEALELSGLPLNREVSRELQRLARERNVKRLTKEELEKLRERLRERRYEDLLRESDEVYAVAVSGAGGSANSSGRPGRGGLNRGPGSAPVELSNDPTELGTTRTESVRGADVSEPGFGETVGVGIGEHELDTSPFRGREDAGAVASGARGGDVVWSQRYTPAERRVLQNYFKHDR